MWSFAEVTEPFSHLYGFELCTVEVIPFIAWALPAWARALYPHFFCCSLLSFTHTILIWVQFLLAFCFGALFVLFFIALLIKFFVPLLIVAVCTQVETVCIGEGHVGCA